MDLISLIIPIYNTERYLRKCLNSIFSQTYTNWEAILINDGSLDESGKICDEYAAMDCRFKTIHQNNQGVVSSRKNGLSAAKGDFILFVDSDDHIGSTMLEEMLAVAKKKDLDIVWCNFKEIYKDDVKEKNIELFKNNEDNIKGVLTSRVPGYLWNKLIKRDFWNRCNIHADNDAVMCEDTYISIQLLARNPKTELVSESFYNYLKYNETAATATNKKPILVLAEKNIVNIYNFLERKGLFEKYHLEFTSLAIKLKIEMLPYDIDRAFSMFPFAHKSFINFKFPLKTSLFYWIAFNSGFLGKILFKFKIRRFSR